MSPDLTLAQAVQAILLADRPAGLPADVSIRAMGDTQPVERPYLVAFCEDGASPHPQLRQTTLVLRLRTRGDEQDPAAATGWHRAAVDYFRANPACLRATLAPHGITLTNFTATDYAEAEEPARGREYDQRWKVWMRVPEA